MIELGDHFWACDPDTKAPSFARVEVIAVNAVGPCSCVLREVRHITAGPYALPINLPGGIAASYAHLVIEDQPFIATGKVAVRDIIKLAQSAGAVASHFHSHEWVTESVWKRGVAKTNYHAWVLGSLMSEELRLIEGYSKTVRKEVLDAVGIAFWRSGRTPWTTR